MHLLTGEFQKTLGLRPIQGWHGLQEFVQREAGRQMIDEHLHWNPGSPKAGRPGQPVRVDPDDFAQSPKGFRLHSSKVQETEASWYLLNDSGIVGSRTETGGRDETAAPEHG